MKVAIIGSGGREHAVAVQLKKSSHVDKIYCLPGNAGIAEIADCAPIGVLEFDKIVTFCKDKNVNLVFVTPDDPLALGLVNRLTAEGIRAFGPVKEAAILEASKAFSKDFMKRHNIPTADYCSFDNYEDAKEYVKNASYPIVVKADGLALGKGVIICNNICDADKALNDIMRAQIFGKAGRQVVIEEFLTGTEVSLLTFTDGKTIKCMPSSQDHKKAFDGDFGPNTGGMGAFAPSPAYTEEIAAETLKNIVYPTIEGLNSEGIIFKGVLYFGLIITKDGVKVLEYNARFGDPETQAVLPLLKTDFLDVIDAVIDGTLDKINIEWLDKTGFNVVIASGGYPVNVVKGFEITIGEIEGARLFHAGTKIKDGKLVTNGGRVFNLCTVADTLVEARNIVYSQIDKIQFEGARYRTDIGVK